MRQLAGIAQSVDLDWIIGGTNPGADETFTPVQTSPGAHLASCIVGTRHLTGVKWSE
jgi:hypothetical protein